MQLACTALVVGTTLIAASPARAGTLHWVNPAAQLAVQPTAPAVGAVACGKLRTVQQDATEPPARCAALWSETACAITRRAARTRLGGRFGP
ncbi:MAG: hypothetical protein H6817_05540 [Phycisphaerales bacterium]|nr:hypothetical protein [Phycisphaerales bacterium]